MRLRGFPAPAGIDPIGNRQSGPHLPRRLPRTRGDRPSTDNVFEIYLPASPHPRG